MRALAFPIALGLCALPVSAQETLDIPVTVEILNPGDLVSMSVETDGNLGQIARASAVDCLYEVNQGTLFMEDLNSGERNQAPGATSAGCAQFGETTLPVIEVSCPAGMTIPIAVGVDVSLDRTVFSASSVLFDGTWINGASGSGGYGYQLYCPLGGRDAIGSHDLELGIAAYIPSFSSVTTGKYDVFIPVTVLFE